LLSFNLFIPKSIIPQRINKTPVANRKTFCKEREINKSSPT
jgi:hypothetical protein